MDLRGVTGVVLCGGASRRMGRDKAALPLGEGTFLRHQARKLLDLGVGELLLSGGDTALPGARLVPDRFPGRGPLGGLHACLAAARGESCLVLSVDVPLVPGRVLADLAARHLAGPADVTALAAGRGAEPLIALYRRRVLPVLEELLAPGPAPVRALLDRVTVETLPYTGPPELLCNCNTPEDYQAVLAHWRAQPADASPHLVE